MLKEGEDLQNVFKDFTKQTKEENQLKENIRAAITTEEQDPKHIEALLTKNLTATSKSELTSTSPNTLQKRRTAVNKKIKNQNNNNKEKKQKKKINEGTQV